MTNIGYATMSVIPSAKGFGAALTSGLAPELESAGKSSSLSFSKGFTATAIVAAVVSVGVAATDMAAKMQVATSKIQANAQTTAQAATSIGDAFLATAGSSTFTGKAMADALGPVAGIVQTLAGHTLTAKDAMLLMASSTTLAEASGVPLTNTTADLTAVMQAFGLKLTDASSASNILFNTSRLTGVGLDTLTSTVDKLHGKLGIAAPDLTDVSALMDDLANHGISGSRGLMVVNSAMSTLMGGSKATTAELKTLGINVYNSSGQFVGMGSVLGQLSPKLAGMSQEQRNVALTALLGKAGAAALTSTVLAGAAGFDKATAAVTAHNAVQAAAAAMSGTLEGQWKTLTSTITDLWTMLGEKLMPVAITGMAFISGTAVPALKDFATGFENGTGAGGDLKNILTSIYNDAIVPLSTFFTVVAVPAVAAFVKGFADGTGPGGLFRDILVDLYNNAVKPIADYLTTTMVPAIKGFVQGFTDGKGPGGDFRDILVDLYNNGVVPLAGFITVTFLPALGSIETWITKTGLHALTSFGSELSDNSTTLGVIAGAITLVLLPALISMAVQATISGGETAAIWLMLQGDAIASTATQVAQMVISDAKWVASGVVAGANAAVVVAGWVATGAGAIAQTAVSVAQFAVQFAKWLFFGETAGFNAAIVVGAWVSTAAGAVANTVTAVAQFAIQVTKWLFLGTTAGGTAVAVTTASGTIDADYATMGSTATVFGSTSAAGWLAAIAPVAGVLAAFAAVVVAVGVMSAKFDWFRAANGVAMGLVGVSIATFATEAIANVNDFGNIWATVYNGTIAPVIKLLLIGFADLALGVGGFLLALSHIPGFGWAKTAADAMSNAAQKALDLAAGIGAIPASKTVTLNVKADFSSILAGAGGVAYGVTAPGGAAGGPVTGGVPGKDSVLRTLMPGEYIVRADGSNLGNALAYFGGAPGMANGGPVSLLPPPVSTRLDQAEAAYLSGTKFSAAPSSGGGIDSGGASSGGNPANRAIMQAMFANVFGWTGAQWNDAVAVEMREAGFSNTAQNPTSSAYGMGQFLDTTWAGYGPKTSDPYLQSLYMGEYIKGRYVNPAGALAHEQAFGWYANGTDNAAPGYAWVGEQGKELVHFGGGEGVTPNDKLGDVAGGRGGNGDVVAAVKALGDQIDASLQSQARTMQTMQRQMARA